MISYAAKRKAFDIFVRATVSLSSVLVVSAFLGIVFVIISETLPLFLSPSVRPKETISRQKDDKAPPVASPLYFGVSENLASFFFLEPDGSAQIITKQSRSKSATGLETWLKDEISPAQTNSELAMVVSHDGKNFIAITNKSQFLAFSLSFNSSLMASNRAVVASNISKLNLPPATEGKAVFDLLKTDSLFLAASTSDNKSITVSRSKRSKSLIDPNRLDVSQTTIPLQIRGAITAVRISPNGRYLFAATSTGELVSLRDTGGTFRIQDISKVTDLDNDSITHLDFLIGGQTLIVRTSSQSLSSWTLVAPPEGGEQHLTRLHQFRRATASFHQPETELPIATSLIEVSTRNRHFVSVERRLPNASLRQKSSILPSETDLGYTASLFYGTTGEKQLGWKLSSKPLFAAFNTTGDTLAILGVDGEIQLWEIQDPHPEVSLTAFFRAQLYEGYNTPAYVWQSSGGSDSVEPKLNLVPLIFGTLKAMVLTLLFSVPLAVLSALYSAQFATPQLRRILKPSVEFLAAIPSVVLGLVAAIWLAPMLGGLLTTILAFIPCLIVCVVLAHSLQTRLALRLNFLRNEGAAFVFMMLSVSVAVAIALLLGKSIDSVWFAGNFGSYIDQHFGINYDQRNSLCVAFCLSLAVIPIIFTISEDCISGVPPSIRAAAFALGASHWKAAITVVLPAAMPGVFSAIMIGLGRAVGETMIVLMASGNTPILSGSPFQGLRAMSANLAIELPEAAYGSTLYRTLFFSALLLLLFTFVINTLGEIVRTKMRKQFSNW